MGKRSDNSIPAVSIQKMQQFVAAPQKEIRGGRAFFSADKLSLRIDQKTQRVYVWPNERGVVKRP